MFNLGALQLRGKNGWDLNSVILFESGSLATIVFLLIISYSYLTTLFHWYFLRVS